MTIPPVDDSPDRLTRPIVGIKNRTAQEVFDIMADRIRRALAPRSVWPTEEDVERATRAMLLCHFDSDAVDALLGITQYSDDAPKHMLDVVRARGDKARREARAALTAASPPEQPTDAVLDAIEFTEGDPNENRRRLAILEAAQGEPTAFLRKALDAARSHLIVLGGDGRGDPNGDIIQAAVLDVIDAALGQSDPLYQAAFDEHVRVMTDEVGPAIEDELRKNALTAAELRHPHSPAQGEPTELVERLLKPGNGSLKANAQLRAEAAAALTRMGAEIAELDFLLHEGGTWEQQLQAAEDRAEAAHQASMYAVQKHAEATARAEASERRASQLQAALTEAANRLERASELIRGNDSGMVRDWSYAARAAARTAISGDAP